MDEVNGGGDFQVPEVEAPTYTPPGDGGGTSDTGGAEIALNFETATDNQPVAPGNGDPVPGDMKFVEGDQNDANLGPTLNFSAANQTDSGFSEITYKGGDFGAADTDTGNRDMSLVAGLPGGGGQGVNGGVVSDMNPTGFGVIPFGTSGTGEDKITLSDGSELAGIGNPTLGGPFSNTGFVPSGPFGSSTSDVKPQETPSTNFGFNVGKDGSTTVSVKEDTGGGSSIGASTSNDGKGPTSKYTFEDKSLFGSGTSFNETISVGKDGKIGTDTKLGQDLGGGSNIFGQVTTNDKGATTTFGLGDTSLFGSGTGVNEKFTFSPDGSKSSTTTSNQDLGGGSNLGGSIGFDKNGTTTSLFGGDASLFGSGTSAKLGATFSPNGTNTYQGGLGQDLGGGAALNATASLNNKTGPTYGLDLSDKSLFGGPVGGNLGLNFTPAGTNLFGGFNFSF